MSDQTSAQILDGSRDFIQEHRDAYLRSGGAEGHIMDISATGGHPFTAHCLIRTTGRKSGKVYIAPLIYGVVGGEVVIVASKGGADHHPGWYHNIRESKTVDFQIATQAFRGPWREPKGAERQKVWDYMVELYPSYADYQSSTDREIPIVMLTAGESIPVFREEDATGVRPV